MIGFIITLAIIGFVLWIITRFVPMPSPYREVFIGIACLMILLYALQHLGIRLP